MAFHKKVLYPREAQIISECSAGVNYPSRSKILIDLMDGDKTSHQLLKGHEISISSLRDHINKLVSLNFVEIEKFQMQPIYRLIPNAIPPWIYFALIEHPDSDLETILTYLPSELRNGIKSFSKNIND